MKDPVVFARALRREQTAAERRFWVVLQPWRANGWHFRRQAPIGPFVVDFVCKRARVVFEIDGESHYSEGGIAGDERRTLYLTGLRYRIVRFSNLDVLESADGVFEVLTQVLGPVDGPAPGWGPGGTST